MITDYGFEWGPMKVVRLAEHEGRVFLKVEGAKDHIVVYLSPKGNSLRVFWNNRQEMIPSGR